MQAIRTYLINYLKQVYAGSASELDNLNDDTNILEAGFIDSFGFLDLILHLEEEAKVNIDFSITPPDQLTTLSGLLRYIESQR